MIMEIKYRRPLKRGSIYMDFSLTRQEKCDLLIQVASTGSFDCIKGDLLIQV
jgi:hypothetical protein